MNLGFNKPLPKNTRLCMIPNRTNELINWYTKLDDDGFGWWSLGIPNFNKNLEEQRYVRMDNHHVQWYLKYMFMYNPKDYYIGREVEHIPSGIKGKISLNNLLDWYKPHVGIFWYQNQETTYFWKRPDEVKFI